jgi:endonuclease YncB( thermonuclease family)
MSDLYGELANGFDRSPTELAALYLELVPDGDAVAWLVENGHAAAAAKEAVSLIDGQARPRSKRGKSVDPA